MADAPNLAKLVPGFDFLQGLVKNAGAALPSIGQWIAPTLNPEELEKRIDELRTVQFWLEQNARMLAATIQALEVQRMTLSTLKTMNVQMGDLRDSLQIRMPGINAPAIAPAPSAASDGNGKGEESTAAAQRPAARKAPAKTDTGAAAPSPGAVDPLQWWGALTKQFTQLAADAMKESATDAAKNLAGSMMKQSFDAATRSLQGAMPGAAARNAASASAAKSASAAPAAARNAAVPAKKEAAPRKRAAPRRAG